MGRGDLVGVVDGLVQPDVAVGVGGRGQVVDRVGDGKRGLNRLDCCSQDSIFLKHQCSTGCS